MSEGTELETFINLNLAIVFIRTKREQEYDKVLEKINPETLTSHSHSLKAAAYYVHGLQSFFQAKYNEAKYVYIYMHILFIDVHTQNLIWSFTSG